MGLDFYGRRRVVVGFDYVEMAKNALSSGGGQAAVAQAERERRLEKDLQRAERETSQTKLAAVAAALVAAALGAAYLLERRP